MKGKYLTKFEIIWALKKKILGGRGDKKSILKKKKIKLWMESEDILPLVIN
jgi:hypothetical protein